MGRLFLPLLFCLAVMQPSAASRHHRALHNVPPPRGTTSAFHANNSVHLFKRNVRIFRTSGQRIAPSSSNSMSSLATLPSSSSLRLFSLLRGGATSLSDLVPSVLSPSSGATLVASTFLTAYMLIAGVALLVSPVGSARVWWNENIGEITKDDFETALLQATGGIVLGTGIHVLLTLVLPLMKYGSGDVSVARAMGYSLLPRIGIILWSLVKGDRGGYQLQGSSFLKLNFAVMTWTAFSLLADIGNPNASTKVFSTMAMLKAVALVTNPVMMTQKFFSVDVSDKAKSRFFARVFGNSLASSAILMMTLAYGISPVRAVGVASGAWFVLLFDMTFVSQCWKWLGQERYDVKQFVHLIISFVVASVLLLYKE